MDQLDFIFQAIPTAFLAMITVINPLGTGFLLSALTSRISPAEKRALARKIIIYCNLIFIIILLFGHYILAFFGLSLPIIRVGGGLLLAYMGWSILNAQAKPQEDESQVSQDANSYLSSSFFPFTFPVTVGPGSIAVLFTLSAHHNQKFSFPVDFENLIGTLVGLFFVSIVVYFCYVYSFTIKAKVGQMGAEAINRIMAFVTFCIGLQILWLGVDALIKSP